MTRNNPKTVGLPPEDAHWLIEHRRAMERRSRVLKGIAVILCYFTIAFIISYTFTSSVRTILPFIFASMFCLGFVLYSATEVFPEYDLQVVIGFYTGLAAGVIIWAASAGLLVWW